MFLWAGCILPPPPSLLMNFQSVYEIMAIVSILVSCLQPVSILSNPAHLNQSILIKFRLWSCHFTAQNLRNYLRSLLTSAATSTMHLLNEVIASHHEWIFWHYAHSLSVAVELDDFLFSQAEPRFYGTVPLLILFSPPIILHVHLSKFYPSKAHLNRYLLHDVFQISAHPKNVQSLLGLKFSEYFLFLPLYQSSHSAL